MMVYVYILCGFLFLTNARGADLEGSQLSQGDLNTLQGLTSFAKNALIQNTNLAKSEFGIEDEQPPKPPVNKNVGQDIVPDDQYKTGAYRDIFFTPKESALINQALDYYKQGKQMFTKARQYKIEKVEYVRKPLLKLSSIIYDGNNAWTAFTSAGKFKNNDYKRGNIEVTGISRQEVEFTLPVPEYAKNRKDVKNAERITMDGGKLVITLRTGECIFEEELMITKNCSLVTEMVDKEIEIKQH